MHPFPVIIILFGSGIALMSGFHIWGFTPSMILFVMCWVSLGVALYMSTKLEAERHAYRYRHSGSAMRYRYP